MQHDFLNYNVKRQRASQRNQIPYRQQITIHTSNAFGAFHHFDTFAAAFFFPSSPNELQTTSEQSNETSNQSS